MKTRMRTSTSAAPFSGFRDEDRGRGRITRQSRGRERGRENGSERGRGRRRERVRGRGRQSRSVFSSGISERWHTSDEADIPPPVTVFRPARTPGPQLTPMGSHSALELFQLYLSSSVCQMIIQNYNAYAAKNQDTARKPWQDMSVKDLYSYLSVVIYMGLVKVPALTDYWNGSRLYRLGFPASVISGRKFHAISSAPHLSDPKKDAENMEKKGTPAYDRLGKLKPVYQQIRDACKTFFHPHQNIAVDGGI